MLLAPTHSARSSARAGRIAVAWLAVAVLAYLGLRFWIRAFQNYRHFDYAHYQEFWLHRWWLIAHIAGGSVALLLGPFQFSSALRRRSPRAHRWIGRLYLLGVAVGFPASVYMGVVADYKPFGIALEFMGLAWFTTSLLGYVSAIRGRFAAHKQWMIRSYVVTFAFVAFRWLEDLNVFGYLGGGPQSAMLAWIAWTMPLLIANIILQWRDTWGRGRVS